MILVIMYNVMKTNALKNYYLCMYVFFYRTIFILKKTSIDIRIVFVLLYQLSNQFNMYIF